MYVFNTVASFPLALYPGMELPAIFCEAASSKDLVSGISFFLSTLMTLLNMVCLGVQQTTGKTNTHFISNQDYFLIGTPSAKGLCALYSWATVPLPGLC